MKTAHLISLLCIGGLLTGSPALAMEKGKEKSANKAGNAQSEGQSGPSEKGSAESKAQTPGKEPWIEVKAGISQQERQVIKSYVDNYGGKKGKKTKRLPPGLAKKVDRGGQLPPGWQKKIARGEVMPTEVYQGCHPLPPDLVVKLPPTPPDTITVSVSGKVVRLAKATHEILDVFDVHLPL